ncbi:MAG TPA: ABC transporter substrate-binding protein [Blastocatellia bacterium]|nr:ABC transporter substrate-binding protein [Blastocatellia bacterium]
MTKLSIISVSILLMLPIACSDRPKRIVIGIALSMSNHAAVELAVKEINESGGVRGVPIELRGLDWKAGTHFDAPEILNWAEKLSQTRDLVAVIGHSDSASTLSAAAFYNRKRVPQIVTIATNPAITNIGDWTYRLCLSDVVQGDALAEYAVRDWGKSRIAMFYVNDAYGTGLAEVFEKGVRERGARIVSARLHRNTLQEDDKAMIRSTLAALKRGEGTDLFVLFQRMAAADWTIRAIREAGFKSDILGGDALGLPVFAKSDPDSKEGIRVSEFFLPSADNAQAMHFVKAMERISKDAPDYGMAFAYDAVYLIRDAVLSRGFSREGVKRYLDGLIESKTAVQGVGGTYRLDEDHDARRSLYIAEARGGVYRRVKVLPIN